MPSDVDRLVATRASGWASAQRVARPAPRCRPGPRRPPGPRAHQQALARGHQALHAHVEQRPLESALGLQRSIELEDEHRGRRADAERKQPVSQLLLAEVAVDSLRQDVPGQAALGVAHDPPAHQLEGDHRHGLLEDQPLELAQRRRRRGLATSHACGPRRLSGATGSASAARPAARARARRDACRPSRAAAQTSAATALTAAAERSRRNVAEASTSQRRVEDQHGAADRGRERARNLVDPALLEHQLLEAALQRDPALQGLVLLVDEVRERLLGDRDERHLVRHLEQREAELLGLVDGPPAGSRRARARCRSRGRRGGGRTSRRTYSRCSALVREAQAGRQQQLAAGHPWSRVGQLADVDPADRRLRAGPAGNQLEADLVEQSLDVEHGSEPTRIAGTSAGEPSCPRRPSAPCAGPTRSRRTRSRPRSAAATAGSRGRPRSSARQIRPLRYSSPDRKPRSRSSDSSASKLSFVSRSLTSSIAWK